MSVLAQESYKRYFAKGASSLSSRECEWFAEREEPESLQQMGGAYGAARVAQHQSGAIKSVSRGQDYFVRYALFPEIRRVVKAEYATCQQRNLEARSFVLTLETPQSLEIQFRSLATRWKEETRLTSSLSEIVLNPSYQRIIGLGPKVIPLVLKELKESGGHWFWALQALSGANPVNDEDAGRVRKMTSAWLEWGRENGLI